MSLTQDYLSDEMTTYTAAGNNYLQPKVYKGRVRIFQAHFKNTTGGNIATGKNIFLTKVPACRILSMSQVQCTAFGAGATLNVGWDDYVDNNNNAVANSITGIASAIDVSAAAVKPLNTAIQGLDITGPANLFAQTGGAVMPNNAEFTAMFLCVID